MKVIIKGTVLVKDAPTKVIDTLKGRLTFDNPKYVEAKKNGRWISPDTPELLTYYSQRGSSILIPRASIGLLLKLTGFNKNEMLDQTVAPTADFNFTGKLRPYQEEAFKAMLTRRYGILEAATGSGKTIMGIAYAAERKLKTLVIVHNKELFEQWQERFKQFTDIEKVGRIGGGFFELEDVTIGIINSVARNLNKLKDKFGVVLLDECHRAIGETWVNTINALRPRFHMGMSATPYRSDKLTEALFVIVGPIIHKVDRKVLEDTGAVLSPRIIRRMTKFDYKFNNDYVAMMHHIVANENRNLLIANDIIDEYRKYREPIMVVSDRVNHCEALMWLVEGNKGIRPIVMSGRMPKGERTKAIIDMKNGEYNVLIATVQLLGEGFDAPDLNSIFLTTPIKFQGRTLQTIGRILRPSKGGQPKVYDYRDTLVPVLRVSGFGRDRIYKAHGWTV